MDAIGAPDSPIVVSSPASPLLHKSATGSPPSRTQPFAGAWVTFLTGVDASYLPGVLVLAHSLRSVGSRYPLVVGVDRRQPKSSRQTLTDAGLETFDCTTLAPEIAARCGVADRFVDTFTKLRAWELEQYDRVVLIDST